MRREIVVAQNRPGLLTILFPNEITESEFDAMYHELNGVDYQNINLRIGVTVPGNRKWCEMTWVKKDEGE